MSLFKPPVSQLYTTVFPAANSTLYVATSFIDSTISSPPEPVSPELPLQPRIIYSSYPQSTASSSTKPFIPKFPVQPRIVFPSSTTTAPTSFISTSYIFPSHTTYFSSPFPSSSSRAFNTSNVITSTILATTTVPLSLEKIQAMAARYDPLVLPQNLHDMPQN